MTFFRNKNRNNDNNGDGGYEGREEVQDFGNLDRDKAASNLAGNQRGRGGKKRRNKKRGRGRGRGGRR